MANLTNKQYLLEMETGFKSLGYETVIGTNGKTIGASYNLTARKMNDLVQIRIDSVGRGILGHYKIGVYANRQDLLNDVNKVNQTGIEGTGFFNFEKKEFHGRMDRATYELMTQYNGIVNSAGGQEKLRRQSREAVTDLKYKENLGIGDFITPAIGLEFDGNGIHPVFGIAIGGDRLGGLLLYDPFSNEVQTGGYVGFGGFGLGGVTDIGSPGEILHTVSQHLPTASDISDSATDLAHHASNALEHVDHSTLADLAEGAAHGLGELAEHAGDSLEHLVEGIGNLFDD